MRINRILFIVIFLATTAYSCKDKGGKNIDQGEIHYNIDYIGSLGGVPKEALPQNLIVYFKKNKTLFEMLGFGRSGIINLANPDKKFYDTYFSFFTKKYYYESQAGEIFPGFEAMEGMIIKKTSRTAVICGFNCKNAEVYLPAEPESPRSIWYTTEINVKNSNAASPFHQIDGVLMDFFFIMGPSELHFAAETVYSIDVPDQTFDRKEKYIKVSKEDIKKVMNQMLSL